MKKIILAALASLCTLSSCMEEITVPEAVSADLYTEIEQNDQTRTVMDEDNKILWSEGDQVAAFMQAPESQKYQIKDEYVGKSYGHFSQASPASSNEMGTSSEWDHNVIYYPYSSTVQCERLESDYNLSIVFPSEQTYAPESFGNGTFPMVAVSTTTNFAFRNVGGGMKLQFKGSSTITSIKVQGNNNEKLSGKATVTAYADGTVPSIEFASDASTSVTLNCGDGVQLNENTVT
jgi:hypothetical protein